MRKYRYSGHTVTRLTVHIVWVTKYHYKVLRGDVQKRCRELLIQVCDSEDVRILNGVVSKDHVHMHVGYPSSLRLSDLSRNLTYKSSFNQFKTKCLCFFFKIINLISSVLHVVLFGADIVIFDFKMNHSIKDNG